MQEKTISEMSDQELVETVGSTVVGTRSGLRAQMAEAELLRRNTEALNRYSESSDNSADQMFGLSLVVGLIAFLQLMFAILSSSTSLLEKCLYGFGAVALMVLVFRDYLLSRKDTAKKPVFSNPIQSAKVK